MFKIESYVTPIILSYVEKYVKNVRPEDSQVSLWGGEVVFQNLDLKLDVLEEELQLPFNFLSGHIHELSIRVPWTKIASEPIVITINTIEFVLKLRDPNDRTVPKKEPPRKGKSVDEAPPPGYTASLISKIANNITIRCHNVILKYVEEDIVVSMNIQQLSMESADANWNAAFIDLSPTKVSLRKLINIVDLTICLDKRNSAGKIEVCQEPVLYRSTLQVRMLVRYNVSSQDRSSLTRIDVHSNFLDINVSSQQFPMLMRLFDLALALKQGKINAEPPQTTTDGGHDLEDESGQESLLSWAWNLLPSFFPEENESDHSEEHDFRVLHAGVYVDRLRMIFKTQELIGDGIVGTQKKIKYTPILRFDFQHFYGEMVACGMKWFNVTLGISRIQLQSMDDCTCGQRATVKELFESTAPVPSSEECLHLQHSFFNDSAGGNAGRKYNVNWNYHLSTYSQEYLLQKSPAIAIDLIHEVQLPDDRRTSEFGSDLEFSNLAEKYMIRVYVGRFRAALCADAIHRFQTLASYRDCYEYPPYYEDRPMPTLSQLPPPSAEDYDALMSEIPLRQIHITLQNPTIELSTFDHAPPALVPRKPPATTSPLPIVRVELSRAECNILTPLYPNRLVYTTCQLPEPPAKLFDACYQSISGNLERMQAKLVGSRGDSEANACTAVSMNYQQRLLIHPSLWPNVELNKVEHTVTITDLKFIMNPLQALALGTVVQSLVAQQDATRQWIELDSIPDDTLPQQPHPVVDMLLSYVQLRKVEAESTEDYKLVARSMKLLTSQQPAADGGQRSLTALWPDHSTDEDFLTVIFQIPKSFDTASSIEHPPLLYAKLLDLSFNLDPNFIAFLCCWQQLAMQTGRRPFQRGQRTQPFADSVAKPSSMTGTLAKGVNAKQHSLPGTSVHSSSDKVGRPVADPIGPVPGASSTLAGLDEVDQKDHADVSQPNDNHQAGSLNGQFWTKLAKKIIIHLEISHFTVCFPVKNIIFHSSDTPTEDEFGENEIFMLKLPLITVNSAFKCQNLSSSIARFPISIPKAIWPEEKESFPWTISLANASSWTYQNGEMNKLLDETTTNISMVLNFPTDTENEGRRTGPTSICFHVDTSPFRVTVVKEQLALIHDTLDRLMQLPMLQHRMSTSPANSSSTAAGRKPVDSKRQFLEIAQPSVAGSSIAAVDLKEFLDLTHHSSAGGSDETLKDNSKARGEANPRPSLWLQWTFSRLTVNCITRDEQRHQRIKLTIEFEDIIYSLDRQEVYSQVKAKVGSMSGACYEWSGTGKEQSWCRNEALAITVQTGDSSESGKSTGTDTFFSLTITRAETQNVHSKWDTVRRSREHNETLVEVLIKMEQVDLRLDLDLLGECMKMLQAFRPTVRSVQDETAAAEPTPSIAPPVVAVKDLPLILFASKGVTVFLPLRNRPTVQGSSLCSVYILKVSSITVHHNVENPICRVPLRPDVYTKAAQMRILNVPGSKIEDRQYELLLKEISLSTAVWEDVLRYLQEQQSSTTHHDNPAFEWNNFQQGAQRSAAHFEAATVFKEFNFSVIYAPCIIYKNVLICSVAMELNCLSDLLIDVDLEQLRLMEQLLRKASQIRLLVFPDQPPTIPPPPSISSSSSSTVAPTVVPRSSESFIAETNTDEASGRDSVRSFRDSVPSCHRHHRRSHSKLSKCEQDSGLESYRTSEGKRATSSSSRRSYGQRQRKLSSLSSESNPALRPAIGYAGNRIGGLYQAHQPALIIPYEVCFLGGYFKVRLFVQDRSKGPTVRMAFAQPNALVSLNLFERILQLSLFDIKIEVGELPILGTVTGEPDELGIPQPFVKTRFVNSHTKKVRELRVDFKRPIDFTLSHTKTKALLELSELLGEVFATPQPPESGSNLPKPVLPSRNKFHILRSQLYDMEKIQIGLSQVMMHLMNEDEQPVTAGPRYSVKLSFASMQTSIRIQERPERILFGLEMGELMLIAGNSVILHPFSFDLQLTIAKEYWKRDPLVQIKLRSSYLQLDISPPLFQQVTLIRQQMEPLFEDDSAPGSARRSISHEANNMSTRPTIEHLIPIVPPRFERKRTKEMQEEYYQDDLRAGAFQFIESMKIDELPLPYQIKIINREVGVICWRYPQPRALHQVIVYPVPMNTTKSVNIQCKLEQYSEINATFVELCRFTLSENEKTFLKLPERKSAAAIWRIVMTQNVVYDDGTRESADRTANRSQRQRSNRSDGNEDDADDQSYGGRSRSSLFTTLTDVLTDSTYLPGHRVVSLPYRLHPKIFVACMRVDSMFSAALVPNVDATIDLSPVQINLFNVIRLDGDRRPLPKPFQRYRVCRETADFGTHKFAMLNARRMRGQCSIYDPLEVFIGAELNLQCELLDYHHFTFETVLDMTGLKAYGWLGDNALQVKTISDDIAVRYGPSVGYTVSVAQRLWNESDETDESMRKPLTLYSKYIVCNRTQVALKFGQIDTAEAIYLGPNEICLYAFRSCRHAQQLQIYFTEGGTKPIVTEPFDVSTEGLQQVAVQSSYEEDLVDERMLLVRVESLSMGGGIPETSAQTSITIEGQISFCNMTAQRLRLQYRYYKIIPNSERNYTATVFLVEPGDQRNLFSAANNRNQQSINIAIEGEEGTLGKVGWSGDVPLREIMNGGTMPYLVKVPTTTTREGYLSYWVRIVREKLADSRATNAATGEVLERVLVIVWPLFMVESLLTVNTTAYVEKIDQSFSIYGQGQRRQLNLAGTFSDEHELSFRMNFNSLHGEDKRKALLSYRLIDGKSFFQVPARLRSVEAALDALKVAQQLSSEWPCSREEEQRWRRENSIQEATFPLYHCSAAYEMSCCLMLSIAPWALFINQLGCEVRLRSNISNQDTNIIAANSIIMPVHLESGFTLEMNVGVGQTMQSELILINGTEAPRKSSTGAHLTLPLEGTIEFSIRTESGIMNLVLSSLTENKVRVFILASQFVVTNYSSIDLHCWSFALPANERLEQFKMTNYGQPHSCCYSLPKNDPKDLNPRGSVITMLSNVSQRKAKTKPGANFNHYLTVYERREQGSDFSAPIYLNKPISRKSLSVPCVTSGRTYYHPLSLSIVTHQSQSYMSIYDDPCPSYAIENRTDFNIYVAQSDTVQPNKAAMAVPEVMESNFTWYQTVSPRQTVYYTPPTLDERFPEPQEAELALIFACVSGSAIRWSHPVRTDENKSIFLNIPLYGELKVAIRVHNRTTLLVIDYISQDLEFSAKDIRTRLSNPLRPVEPQSTEVEAGASSSSGVPTLLDETMTLPASRASGSSVPHAAALAPSPVGDRAVEVQSYFRSLMITLFNDQPQRRCQKRDVISFNFDRIGMRMERPGLGARVTATEGSRVVLHCVNVQVDNELHSDGEYDFPVVLCSEDHETKQRKGSVSDLPNHYRLEDHLEQMGRTALCTLHCDLADEENQQQWFSVESVRLQIQPIRAYIEDTYINVLVDYLVECIPAGMVYESEASSNVRIRCEPGEALIPRAVMQQSSYLAEPIKFRSIRIEPLNVLLSVHACMRLYIALDHSPLEFAAFERQSVRTLPIKFGNAVGMHYLSGAIFGGGWVIGSLEILGSPSGLARSVTSGLRDFVSLPVQGLFRGPWGFLVGVTQGSASLIRNITAGTVNSVTKLAQSVSRNLDRLTLDTEHVQRTDALRRRRPQGMTDGFTQGLTGLGISLLGAVGGLAHHPLQATNPIGVVTGMGKGIVGAFTKPISGAAELVALTGQGMLHSVGYNTLPTPRLTSQSLQPPEPISHKALWEPHAACEGTLLFTVQATHLTEGEYRLVLLALYSRALVLYDVHDCQLVEVLDLKTLCFDTDEENDATRLVIRVQPKLPPPSTYDQYPISSRTYEFVRDSTMQLPRISGATLPFNYYQHIQKPSTKGMALAPATMMVTTTTTATGWPQPTELPSLTMEDGVDGGKVLGPTVAEQRSSVVIEMESVEDGDPGEDTAGLLGDETRSSIDLDRGTVRSPDRLSEEDDSERRVIVFLDENYVKYLVTYVNLLQRAYECQSTGRCNDARCGEEPVPFHAL
ncbi:vacuolar protein sorting-associated protein 13B-like [Anopheles albimanus]|uniref:vacuolar protein sorting-associated protein 13B-like n=1 Tax=Anopheles albimanus TaxID=7167 RepID=UPI001641E287|nr:vacuolar protein sorting-associated protein 13B-like [Anopheles albimanus]